MLEENENKTLKFCIFAFVLDTYFLFVFVFVFLKFNDHFLHQVKL